jgi:hypothetical protein
MGDSVFINKRAAVHRGSRGRSVAFPDVCLCPPGPPAGPVPTPLPNTVKAKDLDGGASSVLVEGNPAGKRSSHFKASTGNESARTTGGGVVTHVVQGKAYFQSFSMNVFIEGEPAVRHLDLLTHNHAAPGPGNTPPSPWLSTMLAPAPTGVPRRKAEEEKSRPKRDVGDWSIWVELDGDAPGAQDDELVLLDAAHREVRRVKLARMRTSGAGKIVVFEKIDRNARYSLIRDHGPEEGGADALFVDVSPNELDERSAEEP